MPISVCPECKSAMEVVPRDDVMIDVCPSCRGVWLDGGELEKILIQIRRHEAARVRDEHLAEHGEPARRPEPPREEHRGDRGDDRDRDRRRGRDRDPRHEKRKRKKKKAIFDFGDFLEDLFD